MRQFSNNRPPPSATSAEGAQWQFIDFGVLDGELFDESEPGADTHGDDDAEDSDTDDGTGGGSREERAAG